MQSTQSKFVSHRFLEQSMTGESTIYRVLKMQDSLFVYIGNANHQTFDCMGAAFLTQHTKEATGTSIINVENTESQDLAMKLAARLKKPVIVSCNLKLDRVTKPLIEKRLIQEITEFPEYF